MHNSLFNRSTISRILGFAALALSLLVAVLPVESVSAQAADQFVFQGAGWGHGVGMSQQGARNMALNDIDHVGILNHYYPNTIVSQTAPLDRIRVHLGDAARVEMSSEGSISFERGGVVINGIAAGSISVSAHDGGLQIGNAWTTASPADPVYVSFPMPMKVTNNGHRYLWGKIQLTNRNGEVRVVEDLSLEDYVAGISEMPAAWPLESLMAQAIAARTYAHEVTLHRRNSEEWAQEYDISATTVDQNYIGYDAQDGQWDQKWLAAVSATAGIEIVDSNGPVRAYYSASNGGYTETAAYVFDNDVPYTVSAPDPWDAGGHDWTEWTRVYSQESISRWLGAHSDTAVGRVQTINVAGGAGNSARIDKAVVEITGSNGSARVTGKRLMLVINAGVFGEGGGLAQHLPGTFTTVGNGTGAGQPQPGIGQVPASATPDPVPEDEENGGFVPPPGWEPEPGTGVPPGGGIAPGTDDANADGVNDDGAKGDGFEPPEGWEPEPGTGVPPGQGVAPGTDGVNDDGANDDGANDDGFEPPEGWEPEPGTGVPPGAGVAPSSSAASAFVPPDGWEPEPGTGVAPASVAQNASLASAVLLITRSRGDDVVGDTRFEVLSPTDELAEEARARLRRLQANAAVGLFADIDVEGFIASVAPRPVHGVCMAEDTVVTCVPLAALRQAAADES